MKLKGTTLILAVGLGAAALLVAPPARAEHVRVQIAPSGRDAAAHGAAGRLVPGHGPAFSREEALAALAKIPPARCPCPYTIFVSLPRPGDHGYDGLEWLSISGPGYGAGAMLVSDRTRIPGLVSIYDLKPTVEALERGEKPPVTAERVGDAVPRLERARRAARRGARDEGARRLWRSSRSSSVFALLGLVRALDPPCARRAARGSGRSRRRARLERPGGDRAVDRGRVPSRRSRSSAPSALAAMTARRRALAVALLAIFPLYLLVLAWSTETSSFAAIGARPENGGRFYGFQNQVETMLLVPGLLGAALAGRRLFVPVACSCSSPSARASPEQTAAACSSSRPATSSCGCGCADVPLTARNLALAGAAVVGVGVALVGIDAALGGSSHVTRSLGDGPVDVLGDMAHRLRLSARRARLLP